MKNNYVCSQCGYVSSKWYGKCPECSEWNSFEEQDAAVTASEKQKVKRRKSYAIPAESKARRISEQPAISALPPVSVNLTVYSAVVW